MTPLVYTEKTEYPRTRMWAEKLFHQYPGAQGLCWTSRQDDRAQAMMLFGPRVPDESLCELGPPRGLCEDTDAYCDLLELATTIGVDLVGG